MDFFSLRFIYVASFLAVILVEVFSHSREMIHGYCSTSLTPGTRLMGSSAISSTSRSVHVFRGSKQLSSGSYYIAGETLSVQISSTSGEYVLEADNADFVNGHCSGNNRVTSSGQLTISSSSTKVVKVRAAWATGESTVRISNDFILNPTPSTQSPTRKPTLPGPTHSPTTSTPTITFYPTITPTTTTPSISPATPTSAPSLHTVSSSSLFPSTSVKIIAGIILGIIAILVGALTCCWFTQTVKKGQIDSQIFFSHVVTLMAFTACLLAGAALGLVLSWARSSTSTDSSYLGHAKYSTNKLAFHIVIMTGGFFTCQTIAIALWSLFSVHYTAKLSHVLFHTIAMACMIAGFVAIAKYRNEAGTPLFTTIHSWVGVAAVCAFGAAYLWGSGMALLTRFHPQSMIRQVYDLRLHHRALGGLSLILTCTAVVTGVMDQLPQGACAYSLGTNEEYGREHDPAAYYSKMPGSCKIGNGLAVVVISGTLCALWAVMNRGDSFHLSSPLSSKEEDEDNQVPRGIGQQHEVISQYEDYHQETDHTRREGGGGSELELQVVQFSSGADKRAIIPV